MFMKLIQTIHDARGGRYGSPYVSIETKTYAFNGGYKYMTYENSVLTSIEVSFCDGYFCKKFTNEEEANAYISKGIRESRLTEEVYRY